MFAFLHHFTLKLLYSSTPSSTLLFFPLTMMDPIDCLLWIQWTMVANMNYEI